MCSFIQRCLARSALPLGVHFCVRVIGMKCKTVCSGIHDSLFWNHMDHLIQTQTHATKLKTGPSEDEEVSYIHINIYKWRPFHWFIIWTFAAPLNMHPQSVLQALEVNCIWYLCMCFPRCCLDRLPGGWCRFGGLSLHALRTAQKVLPHGELHLSGDIRRCVAYFNGCLQEAHRCQRIFFLLSRHSDLGRLWTRQKRW